MITTRLTLKNIGLFLLAFTGVVVVSIAGWHFERWINWHYGYEARVRAIVREEISAYVFMSP